MRSPASSRSWVSGVSLALSLLLTATADGQVLEPSHPGHARLALTAERSTLAPGETTAVAVTFTLDPDWHLYWLCSGATGSPPVLRFTAAKGLTVGKAAWPGPRRYVQKALQAVDFVYMGSATILVPVTVAKDAAPGSALELQLAAEWYACDPNECVDGAGKATITLRVAAKAPPVDPKTQARFDAWRAKLPTPLPTDVTARFEGTTLRVDAPKATRLVFFSCQPSTCDPSHLLEDGLAKGPTLRVRYPSRLTKEKQIKGLLALTRGGKTTYHWLTVAAPKPKSS